MGTGTVNLQVLLCGCGAYRYSVGFADPWQHHTHHGLPVGFSHLFPHSHTLSSVSVSCHLSCTSMVSYSPAPAISHSLPPHAILPAPSPAPHYLTCTILSPTLSCPALS